MYRWSDELYIAESVQGRTEEIRQHLRSGNHSDNAYLITLSTNPKNQLDIIHTLYLRESWIARSLPLIVGIAGNRKEALGIVQQILEDTVRDRRDADMRTYLALRHYTTD